MNKNKVAYASQLLESTIGNLKLNRSMVNIVTLTRHLEESLEALHQALSEDSEPVPSSPGLSREEVWMRAWVAYAKNEQGMSYPASWADSCLAAFDDRFNSKSEAVLPDDEI